MRMTNIKSNIKKNQNKKYSHLSLLDYVHCHERPHCHYTGMAMLTNMNLSWQAIPVLSDYLSFTAKGVAWLDIVHLSYLANYSLYPVMHAGLCLSLFMLYGKSRVICTPTTLKLARSLIIYFHFGNSSCTFTLLVHHILSLW